ncbi:MAG TPA: hypothetical protein VJX67_20755 [Blastocatellia bacterium]|nr:hypothetical protein [Blastocatellia bacterium]
MHLLGLTAFLLMALVAPNSMTPNNSFEPCVNDNTIQRASQVSGMPAAERYERWKQSTLGAMSESTAHKYVNVITQRIDDKKGIVKVAICGTNATKVSYSIKSVRLETLPNGERSQKDAGAENRVVTGVTPGILAEQQMTFKADASANAVEMAVTFTDKDGSNYTMTFLLKLDAIENMSIGAAI